MNINLIVENINNKTINQIIQDHYITDSKINFQKFINDYKVLQTNESEYKINIKISYLHLSAQEQRMIHNLSIGILLKKSTHCAKFLSIIDFITYGSPPASIIKKFNTLSTDERNLLVENIIPLFNNIVEIEYDYTIIRNTVDLFLLFSKDHWPLIGQKLKDINLKIYDYKFLYSLFNNTHKNARTPENLILMSKLISKLLYNSNQIKDLTLYFKYKIEFNYERNKIKKFIEIGHKVLLKDFYRIYNFSFAHSFDEFSNCIKFITSLPKEMIQTNLRKLINIFKKIPGPEQSERLILYIKIIEELNKIDISNLITFFPEENFHLNKILEHLNDIPLQKIQEIVAISFSFKNATNVLLAIFYLLSKNTSKTTQLAQVFTNDNLSIVDDKKRCFALQLCLLLPSESITNEVVEDFSKVDFMDKVSEWRYNFECITHWLPVEMRLNIITNVLSQHTDFKNFYIFNLALFHAYHKKDYYFLFEESDLTLKQYIRAFLNDHDIFNQINLPFLTTYNVINILSGLPQEYKNFKFITSFTEVVLCLPPSLINISLISPKSYQYLLENLDKDATLEMIFSLPKVKEDIVEYLTDNLNQEFDGSIYALALWIANINNQVLINLYDEHPLVQKAYSILFYADSKAFDNPKNPYRIYYWLKNQYQTESLIDIPLPAIDVMDSELPENRYSITWNLPALQKKAASAASYTFKDLPKIDKELFKKIFDGLEERLPTLNDKDLKKTWERIEIYVPPDLKYDLKQNLKYDLEYFLKYLKDLLLSEVISSYFTSSGSEETPISIRHYQLYKIVQYIAEGSETINSESMLSEREERLLGLGSIVKLCEAGQNNGIASYYRELPKDLTALEKLSEKEDMVRLFFDLAIQDVLSAGFVKEAFLKEFTGEADEVKQGAHSTWFAENRLSRHVGLRHTIGFDLGTHTLYDYSLALNPAEALYLYFTHTTPLDAIHKIISISQEAFNKGLFSPIKTILERHEGKNFQLEEYIKLDCDELDSIPELTMKGAITLLKAFEYINVDESRKRMLTYEGSVHEKESEDSQGTAKKLKFSTDTLK